MNTGEPTVGGQVENRAGAMDSASRSLILLGIREFRRDIRVSWAPLVKGRMMARETSTDIVSGEIAKRRCLMGTRYPWHPLD